MIDLRLDRESELSFTLNIEGSTSPPRSRLVLKMNDDFELALKGKVEGDKVYVDIPILTTFKESFSGKVIQAYLEVVVDENYFIPWEDNFYLEQPLIVQVEQSEEGIIKEEKKTKISISIDNFKEKRVEEPRRFIDLFDDDE